jgi:hypothetical protein
MRGKNALSTNRLTASLSMTGHHQEIAGAMINLWEFEKVANSLQSNINNKRTNVVKNWVWIVNGNADEIGTGILFFFRSTYLDV